MWDRRGVELSGLRGVVRAEECSLAGCYVFDGIVVVGGKRGGGCVW